MTSGEVCTARHPEFDEQCIQRAPHAYHIVVIDGEPHSWENTEHVKSLQKGKAKDLLATMAENVKPNGTTPTVQEETREVLLDEAATRLAGEEGARVAWVGTHDEWKTMARRVIERLIHEVEEFTADDVWAAGLPMPRTG